MTERPAKIIPLQSLIIDRRQLLRGACTVVALAALSGRAFAETNGLRDAAEAHGKRFGVAVASDKLERNRAYREAVIREADMLVAEYEMKWRALRPDEATFNFDGSDRLVAFAQTNSMAMRGHTLVWHEALPDWAHKKLAASTAAEAKELMQVHINAVVGRYKGKIWDWDVVNEAVDHDSARDDALRASPWLTAMGPGYIAEAFHMAHAADPSARLTYNDYDLEYADAHSTRRRMGVLKLLTRLKKQGVPVQALGLQSHLSCHRPLAPVAFGAFLRKVRKLGIDIIVTELDVRTDKLVMNDEGKAAVAGTYLRNYLETVQANAPLPAVLTWGITGKYSWAAEQSSGVIAPLPLDEWYERTPVWQALYDGWANV